MEEWQIADGSLIAYWLMILRGLSRSPWWGLNLVRPGEQNVEAWISAAVLCGHKFLVHNFICTRENEWTCGTHLEY